MDSVVAEAVGVLGDMLQTEEVGLVAGVGQQLGKDRSSGPSSQFP